MLQKTHMALFKKSTMLHIYPFFLMKDTRCCLASFFLPSTSIPENTCTAVSKKNTSVLSAPRIIETYGGLEHKEKYILHL